MTATVAELRTREYAQCAFAFVIHGLPYMWVTDHSSVTGSTIDIAPLLSTWGSTMPASMGARTVLRGLQLPRFREAFDEKTGMLEASQVSIRLTDFDGTLATLFATEGKDSDVLAQNIPPGVTPLGTSVNIQGGLTVNPRGRHIGLERIGPSGERGYYSCFPWASIGPHHAVNAFLPQEAGPGPIPISVEPKNFAGRWCALYRLYRDPNGTGVSAWPSFQEQYDAGGLIWWGKLLDRGTVEGNRVWSLSVAGPESLLSRTMNTLSFGWTPVTDVALLLTDDEAHVGIEFLTTNMTTGVMEIRNSLAFPNNLLTLSGSKDTWVGQIDSALAAIGTGGVIGYGPDGNFDDYHDARAGMSVDGSLWLQRDDDGSEGSIQVNVVLHEKAWRIIGFDPPLQDTQYPEVDDKQIHFQRVTQGDSVSNNSADAGYTPAPNYWRAQLHSGKLGIDPPWVPTRLDGQTSILNDGNKRYYKPLQEGTPILFPVSIGDEGVSVRLALDAGYIDGQPVVPRMGTSSVDGLQTDQARFFVLRGKRTKALVSTDGIVIDPDGNVVQAADLETEDEIQVIRASWRNNG